MRLWEDFITKPWKVRSISVCPPCFSLKLEMYFVHAMERAVFLFKIPEIVTFPGAFTKQKVHLDHYESAWKCEDSPSQILLLC